MAKRFGIRCLIVAAVSPLVAAIKPSAPRLLIFSPDHPEATPVVIGATKDLADPGATAPLFEFLPNGKVETRAVMTDKVPAKD